MSAGVHFPEIRSLSREECETVLGTHQVGRMAFTFRDRVDIQPVHYVVDGDWLYIRTSEGDKITTLAHNPWMAMEVDEVHGPFDWVSVVVYGTAYRVDSGEGLRDPDVEAHAIEVLQRVFPAMFTADDPVPHRQVLLRIAIRELSGRRASSTWARAEGRDTASY